MLLLRFHLSVGKEGVKRRVPPRTQGTMSAALPVMCPKFNLSDKSLPFLLQACGLKQVGRCASKGTDYLLNFVVAVGGVRKSWDLAHSRAPSCTKD